MQCETKIPLLLVLFFRGLFIAVPRVFLGCCPAKSDVPQTKSPCAFLEILLPSFLVCAPASQSLAMPRMKYHLLFGLGCPLRYPSETWKAPCLLGACSRCWRPADTVKSLDIGSMIGHLCSSCYAQIRVSLPFILPEVCLPLLWCPLFSLFFADLYLAISSVPQKITERSLTCHSSLVLKCLSPSPSTFCAWCMKPSQGPSLGTWPTIVTECIVANKTCHT